MRREIIPVNPISAELPCHHHDPELIRSRPPLAQAKMAKAGKEMVFAEHDKVGSSLDQTRSD